MDLASIFFEYVTTLKLVEFDYTDNNTNRSLLQNSIEELESCGIQLEIHTTAVDLF